MQMADDRARTFTALAKKVDEASETLSKQEQLRVHRWLDKLETSDCGPPTWLRDRNEYVRLLLYMVAVVRRLSEPFHVSPPDGMVPTFPRHLGVRLLRPPSRANEIATTQRQGELSKNMHRNLPLPATSASPLRARGRRGGYTSPTSWRDSSSARIRKLEDELRNEKLLHSHHVQKITAVHRAELSAVGHALYSSVPPASHDYSHVGDRSAPFFGAHASPGRREHHDVYVPSSSFAATDLIAATGIDEALAGLRDLDVGLAELSDDIASGGASSPHVSFASPVRVGSGRMPPPPPQSSMSPYRYVVDDDKQYVPPSAFGNASDDEFLAYVSEFQAELGSLQRASPKKSAIVQSYNKTGGKM